MTNRDVYEAALALLAEEREELCGDYETRAPYLLAAFINESREVNTFYRMMNGGDDANLDVGAAVDLDADFPLEDRFCPVGAYYLAALLIEPEDEVLSDRLFAHYADALACVSRGIPVEKETIRDAYGFRYSED